MPEQAKTPRSIYQNEAERNKEFAKLGRKITDVAGHKFFGVKTDDPEYWGLREVLTEEMAIFCNKMKVRKFYTFEDLLKMNPDYEPVAMQKLLDEMAWIGIIEYDYGDNYGHDGELKDKPKIKRYRLPYFIPGSAELFNSTKDRIEKNPAVASFFERMTWKPLANVTQMVPPGGGGIGMHVIPVEKAIGFENQSVDVEHISHWLKKYEGHISAGMCSCRYSRGFLGDGCADDPDNWCIQVGDMAEYTVETGRAHYITTEEALDIIKKAEENGFVHQITNIDGENKIFDICNCDVKICNALRTSMLFNTPNLSKSAYTAKVTKENCVACGRCVEICPSGAVKLGQKLCQKDGKEVKYPTSILPDKIHWGEYAWDENYRDTMRLSNTYETGTAPCKTACPAHIAIQGYLQMAKEGRYDEALALIKRTNPFPAVCGRVCNRLCEEACTRGTVDEAVAIESVKRFIAERDLDKETRYVPNKVIPKVEGGFDEKIAIIGAGPAGLSCAYYLALLGYNPTVFEKNELPGGMMQYGIPTYKLEKDVLAAEIDVIRELGVEIKTGVEIGKDLTIQDLKDQGYKAFYIAIGCQGGRRPGVPNDDAANTDIAVHFLQDSTHKGHPDLPGKVVVIGGGNVAIDCAINAAKRNAESVTMIALETPEEMPAGKEEIQEAKDVNVQFMTSWGPQEVFVDDNNKVKGLRLKKCLRTIDPETKRFSPVYDESETLDIEADFIVFAIGQVIEWGDLLKDSQVTFHHGNYPLADELTYQTADPDIYVGGDVLTGPSFVINAIAEGHFAAESLHRHVQPKAHPTIGLERHHFAMLDVDNITLPSYDTAGRQEEAMDQSVSDPFRDPSVTLTEEQVKIEASRCLSCGAARVDPHKCIGCGLCTTVCDFDAIHIYRDQPENSKMRPAETKIRAILGYQLKRGFKILFNAGSPEARVMRAKRKAYKKENKENPKVYPYIPR
jgi:NADPH-dependent glutamate synthase beta subunit-like oxidoreductase/formate hydrogenlyase subunit 6/NADH:ubiquinone oxidoreductase subunit I